MNDGPETVKVTMTVKTAFKIALIVGIVGILVGVGAIGYSYVAIHSQSLPVTVTTTNSAPLPTVDQPPTTRDIKVLGYMLSTSPKEPRFEPSVITINQGDTINLTFVNLDNDMGHTFSVNLPGGLLQLNDSMVGQMNTMTGEKFTTPATNCYVNGSSFPCNDSGSPGDITSSATFTINKPGIYEFFCTYHAKLGMDGFIIVLPNAAVARQ